MKMTPQIATLRIQRELAALEATLADGLERTAVLTATLVRARADSGAGIATGQDVLLRLAAVQNGLLKAGSDTARVHQGLIQIGRELGRADEDCPYASYTVNDRVAA